MPQPPKVTVLGSLNMDISVTVPRLAGPGETVLGSAARLQPGGKGANQALAAARLGASVRMVGCCGDDEFGATVRSALTAGGVDVTGVRTIGGAPSGLALITVDAAGENSITVAPGANGLAGQPELAAAFTAPCDALLLSAEIPATVLADALARARNARVLSVLNLAPVPADAPRLVAAGVDWLIVNGPEAGAVLGSQVRSPAEARSAAAALAGAGARHVVITLGAAGAVLGGADGTSAVAGFSVRSVDSVGAGDAFAAALAVAVAVGAPPAEAVRLACAAGAAAVTRPGAQDGLPTGDDVLAATGVRWLLG
ncbi:MAG TPA: PfkB family carbohydrate kinase [Streptosporangiaceae bacterium]|nr:PfkB family carbohydrate kinase [Streptosporangiaceae bacterium]